MRYRDRRRGGHRVEEARRLVLAAGSLNTVRLLLAARDRLRTLPRLPRALGHGFALNGDAVTLLWRTSRETRAGEGPTINAVRRERDDRGRSHFVVAEAGLPVNALRLPRWLRGRLEASVALFGFGRERADATVALHGRHLTCTAGRDPDDVYRAIGSAFLRLAAAYGPARVIPSPSGPGGRLVSVHPVGGARIGRTPHDGVVDHRGQVFGHDGLYVADAALYPCAPGVPPSMTIATLAERIADLVG